MQDLLQTYGRANSDLENKYADAIPKATQDMLSSISALDQAGKLKSIEDWERAKRSLVPIIEKAQLAQQQKLEEMKLNNANFEKQITQLQNTKKIDFKASSDAGYFLNKNGDAMLDSKGMPVKFNTQEVDFHTFDQDTGKLIVGYKDGTVKVTDVIPPSTVSDSTVS